MEYTKASEEMTAIVHAVANEHHYRLADHEIAVVCQERAGKRGGKRVLATASLPTARMKPLLSGSVDFVITIALDAWGGMSEAQREACVDHELCHCATKGDEGKPCIRPHDYEEFAEIVERHGAWRQDKAEAAIQQALGLPAGPVRVSTMKGAA